MALTALVPRHPSPYHSTRPARTSFNWNPYKNDPDYKAIVKAFEPIVHLYTAQPRMDMPGAKLPVCPSPGK